MTKNCLGRGSNNSWTSINNIENGNASFTAIAGEHEDHSNYTGKALSNFLIVQNIFRAFNANDLETCCHVNQLWKFVADPLLTRFDVKLIRVHVKNELSNDPFDREDHVVLKERTAAHNYHTTQECKYRTPDAQKILLKVSKSRRLVINLVISDYGHAEKFDGFVSKFGKLVTSCSPQGSQMTVSDLCKRLLHDFSNLQELDISKYFFYPGNDFFNSSIPENQLKHLRKINVKGFELKNYESLAIILKIGPNLEEIHNFPILLSDSLIVTRTGGLVKTLQYHVGERQELNEETFATALEKFAKLHPKLHSFSFCPPYKIPEDYLYGPVTKSLVLKILHSSHESIKTLTIFQSESFDFQSIPPMTALKEITFMFSEILGSAKLFDPKILLIKTFPNVSSLQIILSLDTNLVINYFPESFFSHWGSQIKRLEIRTVSSDCIQLLSKLFPFVKYLKFYLTDLPDNLHSVLPAISQFWPDLESLAITVDCLYTAYGTQRFQHRTLDAAFTGIADNVAMELKDPSSRQRFTKVELQNFEEASPIRGLSKLKLLKLDVSQPHVDPKAFNQLSTLTPLSYDFGFKFLPDLRFIVRTRKHFDIESVEEIKTALEPLMMFQVERGLY